MVVGAKGLICLVVVGGSMEVETCSARVVGPQKGVQRRQRVEGSRCMKRSVVSTSSKVVAVAAQAAVAQVVVAAVAVEAAMLVAVVDLMEVKWGMEECLIWVVVDLPGERVGISVLVRAAAAAGNGGCLSLHQVEDRTWEEGVRLGAVAEREGAMEALRIRGMQSGRRNAGVLLNELRGEVEVEVEVVRRNFLIWLLLHVSMILAAVLWVVKVEWGLG